jgi:hypothetical protein
LGLKWLFVHFVHLVQLTYKNPKPVSVKSYNNFINKSWCKIILLRNKIQYCHSLIRTGMAFICCHYHWREIGEFPIRSSSQIIIFCNNLCAYSMLPRI